MSCFPVEIRFKEELGIGRVGEPVSVGVPLPMGCLFDTDILDLKTADGISLPLGCRVLAKWSDGSIHRLMIDTQVSVDGQKTCRLELSARGAAADDRSLFLEARLLAGDLIVDTGAARFGMATQGRGCLFKWVETDPGQRIVMNSETVRLTGISRETYLPWTKTWTLDHDTPLKKTIKYTGRFKKGDGTSGPEFDAFFHFYAGKPQVEFDFVIRNPKAAVHRGGAWDLGDENSFLFKDLCACLTGDENVVEGVLSAGPGKTRNLLKEKLSLFQASSGQPAWDFRTHVNADGKIPLMFKGYRVLEDGERVDEGGMADPWGAWTADELWLSCYCPCFWQNSPKAMSLDRTGLRIHLFPEDHQDGFELLPGEQKRHRICLSAGKTPEKDWAWVRDPLIPEVLTTPLFCGGHWISRGSTMSEPYDRLVGQVLDGKHSFDAKNRVVDEFGWRNFGDVWADHESALSEYPLVSHYNNQYDLIKGLVIQFWRSGDRRWFRMARQMAEHVVDIDIYHTREDRPQYNSGLFWHTDHHLDAAGSSHRTISLSHKPLKPPGSFGGGPAPDHNYATGLLYLYWMTGDSRYKDAVAGLAENIIQCFTAPHTLCEWGILKLKESRHRLGMRNAGAVYEEIFRFNGPSRVSGNSLNTLLDAFLITGSPHYMAYAEGVIVRAASAGDDFAEMDLGNSEKRWMYLVFLSALGRFLDLKTGLGQRDDMFGYARDVLLRYAAWMAEEERPFLDTPERLDFPTETWAAQDIRKADIFAWAAAYGDTSLRERFMERCRFFFSHSLEELAEFNTCHYTRPMAVILANGHTAMAGLSGGMESRGTAHISGDGVPATGGTGRPGQGGPNGIWHLVKTFSLAGELKWLRLFLQAR